MKYSIKRIATGVGVAGLMGVGAFAADYPAQQGQQGSYSSPSQSGQPGSSQDIQSGQYQSAQPTPSKMRETAATSKHEQMAEKQSRGTIRAVDTSTRTLTLKGPKMHRDFAWSSNTQVMRNGKSVSPEAIRSGEQVRITFRKEGDRLVAQEIQIQERQQARAHRRTHQER